MKIASTFVFLANVNAIHVESAIEHLSSLQALHKTLLSEEVFKNAAEAAKPKRWNKWLQKHANHFETNLNRMTKAFNRCGVDVPDYAPIATVSSDLCAATTEILESVVVWAEGYLAQCKGHSKNAHQRQRMTKWTELYHGILECNTMSDTLSYPWFSDYEDTDYTISMVCNADFVNAWEENCEDYATNGYCEDDSDDLMVEIGIETENGLETGLNCPQCGCENNNPIKLGERDSDKTLSGSLDEIRKMRNKRKSF